MCFSNGVAKSVDPEQTTRYDLVLDVLPRHYVPVQKGYYIPIMIRFIFLSLSLNVDWENGPDRGLTIVSFNP